MPNPHFPAVFPQLRKQNEQKARVFANWRKFCQNGSFRKPWVFGTRAPIAQKKCREFPNWRVVASLCVGEWKRLPDWQFVAKLPAKNLFQNCCDGDKREINRTDSNDQA